MTRSRIPRRPPRVAGSRLRGRSPAPNPVTAPGGEDTVTVPVGGSAGPAAGRPADTATAAGRTAADRGAEPAERVGPEAAPDAARPAAGEPAPARPRAWPGPSPRPRPAVAGTDAEDAGALDDPSGTVGVFDPLPELGSGPPTRSRPATTRRAARRGWWLVAGTGAVVLALAVSTTMLMLGWRRAEARAGALARVPSLAKADAAKILSYDYRHIRADAGAAAAVTTGDYHTQYRQSMDQLIIPQAQQVRAVVRAEVLDAGVASVSDDGRQAVVLVYANQTVTNTRIQGSRVDQVRVRLTMVRVGHTWRVSKVDSL